MAATECLILRISSASKRWLEDESRRQGLSMNQCVARMLEREQGTIDALLMHSHSGMNEQEPEHVGKT